MKARYVFIVAAILFSLENSFGAIEIIDNRDMEAFGKAVKSVLQQAVNEFLTINILIFESTKNSLVKEIDAIFRHARGELIFKVTRLNQIISAGFSNDDHCNNVCLIIFDSWQTYVNASKETLFCDIFSGIIIKYIDNASAEQIYELAVENVEDNNERCERMEAPNMFTIVKSKESFIELLEINEFVGSNTTPATCDRPWMTTVNRFSKTQLEWTKPLTKLKRREKFNGCIFNYEEGDISYTLETLKEIAKTGDYEYRLIIEDQVEAIDMPTVPKDPISNISIETILIYSKGIQKINAKLPSIDNHLYFVIPRGELYTEWEKLFLAFDLATWCLIVGTFTTAFAVVIVTKCVPRFVRNFIIGRNISSPAINILAIFFGISQNVLPNRNFARFLLMLFLIWSLIIRTCYQGLLYEYLQGDGRKPQIKTIQEMLDRNFTYYIHYHDCMLMYGMYFQGK